MRTTWMTVQEMLDDLGVARSSFDRWVVTGRGPRLVKLPNGQLRCRRSDYDAWLETLELVA